LTNEGAFFSGDFLENRTHPSVATLVDDPEALKASFERVKKLDIRIVYPGHGKPLALDEIAWRSEGYDSLLNRVAVCVTMFSPAWVRLLRTR